jgi:trans-2,3-dihydro-3-hydroxyanthranilate isomerase
VRRFRYVVVDVFTDVPLAGNQLAVFTDARDLTGEEMQALAREMNFSESVFVLPPRAAGADVRIRIFTPGTELPFAGHPTLGTAFVLVGPLQILVLRIESEAGVVPVELYDLGPSYAFVELGSPEEVAALAPDIAALGRATGAGASCFARDGARWKARVFFADLGVTEDPATGSAAGPLAVHLARHGRIAFDEEIEISQGAELGRPSTLYARAVGSPERIDRVFVGGSARLVARGEFTLP